MDVCISDGGGGEGEWGEKYIHARKVQGFWDVLMLIREFSLLEVSRVRRQAHPMYLFGTPNPVGVAGCRKMTRVSPLTHEGKTGLSNLISPPMREHECWPPNPSDTCRIIPYCCLTRTRTPPCCTCKWDWSLLIWHYISCSAVVIFIWPTLAVAYWVLPFALLIRNALALITAAPPKCIFVIIIRHGTHC